MNLIRRSLLSIIAIESEPEHEIIISNGDTFVGKYLYLATLYDDSVIVYPTWTLLSGSAYVTLNQNGKLTINEGVTNQTVIVQAEYDSLTATKEITVSYDNQLTIEGANNMTGTSGNVIARYNSTTITPTWTITEGSNYATIDNSGNITILGSGDITITATYSTYTATKTISLTYVSGASSSTTIDENGTVITETSTTIENQDGSTITTNTISQQNDDGSVSNTSSVLTENSDGSTTTVSNTTNSDGTSSSQNISTTIPDENGKYTTTSTTINYDASGDPTDKVNDIVDNKGNEKTQEIEYDSNGEEVVVGYEVDTTNNPEGNLEFNGNSSDAINTGFEPFMLDGRGFDMVIHFISVASEQKTKADGNDDDSQQTILDMTPDNPANNWAQNQGIVMRWNNGKASTALYIQTRSRVSNSKLNVNPTTVNGEPNHFKFRIYYDGSFTLTNLLTNQVLLNVPSPAFTVDLTNVKVTVGSAWDGINNRQFRYSVMKLIEFNITKLD